MHAANCVSPCMFLHVICHRVWNPSVEPPCSTLAWHLPPYILEHRQSWQGANRSYATELHTVHVSPLKAMGKFYWTQSQGNDTTYQTHSQGYGKLLPLVARQQGEEARLPPFTLHGSRVDWRHLRRGWEHKLWGDN